MATLPQLHPPPANTHTHTHTHTYTHTHTLTHNTCPIQTSFYFHGTQGLFVNEFENKKYGATVQKWLGVVHKYDKGYYLEVLIVYFIVARTFAFLVLKHANRERR